MPITHFVDRQFGHAVHVGTDENKNVDLIASFGYGPEFDKRIRESYLGKPIEVFRNGLRQNQLGHLMAFSSPLKNKYSDYEQ